MVRLVIGIFVVAVIATFGDYVWFEIGVRHQATSGALHGAVLLGAAGAVLGWVGGRPLIGLLGGVAAGVGGAAAYYAMASGNMRSDNFPAMVAAWAAVWLVLAVVEGRLVRATAPKGWGEILMRGVLAAALGGLAFWAVLDVIWGARPAEGRDYMRQFSAWLIAWAPGMLAIGLGSEGGRTPARKAGGV